MRLIRNTLTHAAAAFMALALLVAAPAPAQAQQGGVTVEINKGTILRLPGYASVVAVADPEIADVEVLAPDLVSVQGRGVGQTSIMAFDARGNEILNETVSVSHNITALRRIVAKALPDAEVEFDSISGALVMSGSVESPLQADNIRRIAEPFLGDDQLVNMLDIKGSDQVMLKVRVAEVSRTELKRFGINLSSVLTGSGNFAFGLVTGRDIGAGAVGSIIRGDSNNVAVNYSNGDLTVNSVIDALAEDNLIKVLAEPTLTTASGRSANFLAGGEYPIPVPGENGQVTIEYREYGVGLRFTPQVLSKEKISLTVAPEVSELSQIGAVDLGGFSIPALVTRRAETTVELGSGQSFAIAGLLRNNNSNDVSKFPFLGDIPVLGALFRSTDFQQEQSELMILVTPYIVRGVAEAELTDPTEGYVPPTDADRILLGHTYTPDPRPQPTVLEGSPRDMRKPKFRSTLAGQQQSRVIDRPEQAMMPSAPISKTQPAQQAEPAPVEPVRAVPAQQPLPPQTRAAPAPVTAPASAPPAGSATLHGPVGYMLR